MFAQKPVTSPPSTHTIPLHTARTAGQKSDGFWNLVLDLKIQIFKILQHIWRYRVAIALTSQASVLLFVGYMLFWPQSIHYSFASQKSCVTSPVIFPNLFKTDTKGTFNLNRTPTISIGHMPIFSGSLCAAPQQHPQSKTTYANHQKLYLGGLHIGKSVKIVTNSYPAVYAPNFGVAAIPIDKPLNFKLSLNDATFNYAITANGQTSICAKQNTQLSCSLVPLKLAYAAKYQASLVRMFHSQPAGNIVSKTLQTITATAITSSSIKSGATVYDKPQQITLQTDKILVGLDKVSLTTKNPDGTVTNIPVASTFSGQTVTVSITSPLARKTAYNLHIDNLTASDNSRLEHPYDLPFITSGGPKATSINLPSTGVVLGQTITVSFDQALLPAQDPQQIASLIVNGVKQSTSIAISNNKIVITPRDAFPVCARITVQLSAVAQNAYGVSGDSAKSFGARARCYTTYSIGTSVLGRSIVAYQFGSGPNMILYIGATHGNEQNSMVILQKWISELDANPDSIPAGRTIVVIPSINPDGVAANNRLNAAGIDLNRNFPSDNWQTNVTQPGGGGAMTTAGGSAPLSEPESRALANFVIAKQPRLVLTYHSHAGVVEANEAGDSVSLASAYSVKANYSAIPISSIGNTFDYSTTGAMEDWMKDALNLSAFVIELQSPTADEFTRNRAAMWAMAKI
ncbi:hypothetical protein COU91_03850 [Candidatus Saccharibacteria bacterium CG10_big_fil_rev_8_21_14_0_10_47_8]|nr:MAG: hypothetical protein COU91_03850 [Candidatus Saccharibacteria bacterium CG10_big_fil_rev_8_21_14_0_10_47_8]